MKPGKGQSAALFGAGPAGREGKMHVISWQIAMDIRESYDSAAKAYAEHLAGELAHKPLDRHLLNRFAEETRGRGLVADFGCGPGHVARYLRDQGVDILGIDLSPEMIRVATCRNPG